MGYNRNAMFPELYSRVDLNLALHHFKTQHFQAMNGEKHRSLHERQFIAFLDCLPEQTSHQGFVNAYVYVIPILFYLANLKKLSEAVFKL